MSDIQYYILVSKDITTKGKQRKEIDKVKKEFMDLGFVIEYTKSLRLGD